MPDHGALDLVQARDVFLERQVVDLADAFEPDGEAPINDSLRILGAGDTLVLCKAELLLDGNLCVVDGKGAEGVGQARIDLVAALESGFDVLADIEMLVVGETHGLAMICD